MINVSQDFLNVLYGDIRKITTNVLIYRKDDLNRPVDISDDVEEINITANENSANSTMTITLKNHDGIYTPKNRESSMNLVMGQYDPLLDPCNLIKASCNFEGLNEQSSYTVTKVKNWDIANLSDHTELYKTLITNDGLTLSYQLGPEICEISNTDETTTGTLRVGECYDSDGEFIHSGYKVIQNFRFNTAKEKYVSKIKVKLKKPIENSDPNAILYCALLDGDEESLFANFIREGENTETQSPNIKVLWRTNKGLNTLNDGFNWVTFNCNYSGALQPNKRYGIYLYSNLFNRNWDWIEVLNNDKKYTDDECWWYNNNSMYTMWAKATSDILFEIWHREYIYQSNGYAIYEHDCGDLISAYKEINYISNGKGTVLFEYASSADGINWTVWYTNLADVPVQRYFRFKVTLDSGGDYTNSPIISKISFSYDISSSHLGVPLFTGVLGDEIDTKTYPEKITLTSRDMSKVLQDVFIPISKSYDSTIEGIWYVEDIITDLLDTYLNDESLLKIKRTIVFEHKPTYFLIRHFQVRNDNLWNAIQQLSDAMAESIRFDENGVLRYYPKPIQLTPNYILDENLIVREDISITDSDIRNYIIVKIETPEGILESIKTNDESIQRYGKRYMEVNRSITSMLTTQEQADKLARLICEDLSVLPTECTVELPFFPIVQLGDIVGINSEKAGLSSEIELFRVIGYNHRLTADSKRTTLTLKTHKVLIDNYDKYPNPPTDLTGELIERTIQNYPNSGWTGESKTYYYTKLTWTPPTTNTDTTPISYLIGFNIYRDNEFAGFVPANINGFTGTVNWFIDYQGGPGNHNYTVRAVNKYGKVSENSNSFNIFIPNPTTMP